MSFPFATKPNYSTGSFSGSRNSTPTGQGQPSRTPWQWSTGNSQQNPAPNNQTVERSRNGNQVSRPNNVQRQIDASRNVRGDSQRIQSNRSAYEDAARRRRLDGNAPNKNDLTRRARPDSFEQERIRIRNEASRVNRSLGSPSNSALPKPIRPPIPKTNIPWQHVKLGNKILGGLPASIAMDLLFPDALSNGEIPDFLKDPVPPDEVFTPFEYPTEPNTSYRVYVAIHNSRLLAERIIFPSLPNTFISQPEWTYDWMYELVPGEILGTKKLNFRTITIGNSAGEEADYSGYTEHQIVSTGERVTRIIGSSTASFDIALILALVPIGFPIPDITPDQELELPEDGEIIIIGDGEGFEMEPPVLDPITGIKRKPRWRIVDPSPIPKPDPIPQPEPPWKDWDDPDRPEKIKIQDPDKFRKIELPRIKIPLPPFQEFRPPEKTPEEIHQAECEEEGDCMSCKFNPAVIQRIVNTDGTATRTNDNANKALIVNEVVEIRKNFAGLGAKMDALLSRLNERFDRLAKWLRLPQLLNLLILATVLHNAVMLSGQAVQGVAELMSQVLAIFGIKNEEGQAISVSELVGKGIQDILENAIGAEKYKALTENWAKANRIYQASANILNSVRSLFATTQQLVIWIADNTGKIGNSLKRDGVVTENAFTWMPENNGATGRLGGLINGIDSVTNTTSSLTQVTSDVLTLQEESKQIKENMKALTDEFEKEEKDKTKKGEADKPTIKDNEGKTVKDGAGNPVLNAQGQAIVSTQPSDLKKAEGED